MIILKKISEVGRNEHLVQFEQDEAALPEPVLISMADGLSRKDAEHRHENKQHPGHFGGRIEYKTNDRATITVYTD